MHKAFTDFITYAHANLVWFAFNFVLCVMPILVIFALNAYSENLDRDGSMSYLPLVIILGCTNLIQFMLRPAIYTDEIR